MMIEINRNSKTPMYIQIRNLLKQKIADEELLAGFRLPPERAMADRLGVHRNTVIKAYQLLIEDGLVESRKKPKGYFIADQSDYGTPTLPKIVNQGYDHFSALVKEEFRSVDPLFSKIYFQPESDKVISFAGEIASPAMYPREEIKKIMKDLADPDTDEMFEHMPSLGYDKLRTNVGRVLKERQINTKNNEIQILSECAQGINYLVKLCLSAGDSIIAEEPILIDMYHYFKVSGINIIPVSVDKDGMVTAQLAEILKRHDAKFIYTLPNFHNPTTTVMSLDRRKELLELSYKYNVPIIEEDCGYDFRYEGIQIPPLRAMDTKGHVIYLDSFNFTIYPGVRMAYMNGPAHLIAKTSAIMEMEQLFINGHSQMVVSEFIERGYYRQHMKRLKIHYRDKRDAMVKAMEKHRLAGITFDVPQGGTVLWCKLPGDINEVLLLAAAGRMGVTFMPGHLFYPYGQYGDSYIRLSFCRVPADRIEEGVDRLFKAIAICRDHF